MVGEMKSNKGDMHVRVVINGRARSKQKQTVPAAAAAADDPPPAAAAAAAVPAGSITHPLLDTRMVLEPVE